jgi:5-methyltetrahydrofolate--homocysteine methyltransferase
MDRMEELAENVRNGDAVRVRDLVQSLIHGGGQANEILDQGLFAGMAVVGKLFKEEDIFIPEVLMAAKAMQAGVDVLEPLLTGEAKKATKGKVILGTVKGDLHDLGKNLVKLMFKGAGFEVIDLGVNVTAERFVSVAKTEGARILGMSALLTTTMPYMKTVIEALEEAGLKGKVRTIVGGACVTESYAKSIGADGYGQNASIAVEIARQLINT